MKCCSTTSAYRSAEWTVAHFLLSSQLFHTHTRFTALNYMELPLVSQGKIHFLYSEFCTGEAFTALFLFLSGFMALCSAATCMFPAELSGCLGTLDERV